MGDGLLVAGTYYQVQKFITPNTADRIVPTGVFRQAVGYCFEQSVARVVTMLIVNGLEPI